jgi:hypothetical protein
MAEKTTSKPLKILIVGAGISHTETHIEPALQR